MICIDRLQLFELNDSGRRFAVNHQALPFISGNEDKYIIRSTCRLQISGSPTLYARAGSDTVLLFCCIPDHLGRICRRRPLEVTRDDLVPPKENVGSVIRKLHHLRCHACGIHSKDCWKLWSGHYVCQICKEGGRHKPPFPYGLSNIGLRGVCCDSEGCGEGLRLGASKQKLKNKMQFEQININDFIFWNSRIRNIHHNLIWAQIWEDEPLNCPMQVDTLSLTNADNPSISFTCVKGCEAHAIDSLNKEEYTELEQMLGEPPLKIGSGMEAVGKYFKEVEKEKSKHFDAEEQASDILQMIREGNLPGRFRVG